MRYMFCQSLRKFISAFESVTKGWYGAHGSFRTITFITSNLTHIFDHEVYLYGSQAIVAYHAGRKVDAKNFLGLAEEEARMMHVEPEKLTQSERKPCFDIGIFISFVWILVMTMGYTASEARRGLRSSQGNIEQAVEFLLEV